MSNSAINTQVAQLKIGNVQNQADNSAVYSGGVWSLKNSTALTSVTITDAGNVGVGVTPSPWASSWKVIQHQGGFIGGNAVTTQLASTNSYSDGSNWRYVSTGAAAQYAQVAGEHSWSTAASGTAGNAITFTERMRIDASGNLLVGATSPLATERLGVFGSSQYTVIGRNNRNTSGDVATYFEMGANTNNTASYFINCATTGVGTKFYVYGNGTYGTVSDINLKKNIETARDGYLQDLCKLRVVKYNWKTDKDGAPKELGWIAQELAEVFPGLVQDSEPNAEGIVVKEVKSSVLPFMLLKAIQELSAKNDEQSSRIEALEARLAALEAKP